MKLKYLKKYKAADPKLVFGKCEENLLVINNKFLLLLLGFRKKLQNINSTSLSKVESFEAVNFKKNRTAFFTVESYEEEENYVKLRNDTKIYKSFFEIKAHKIDDIHSILLLESTYNLKSGNKIIGYLYFMIIFIVQRFFIYHIQGNVKRSLDVKRLKV